MIIRNILQRFMLFQCSEALLCLCDEIVQMTSLLRQGSLKNISTKVFVVEYMDLMVVSRNNNNHHLTLSLIGYDEMNSPGSSILIDDWYKSTTKILSYY